MQLFKSVAGKDEEVDWNELKEILDYYTRKGEVQWLNMLHLLLWLLQAFSDALFMRIYNFKTAIYIIRKVARRHWNVDQG